MTALNCPVLGAQVLGMQGPAARLRARGEARASFARVGARTGPARVFETGGLRLRFPHTAGGCEAVLINTGGGMAGGDRAKIAIALGRRRSSLHDAIGRKNLSIR